MFTDKFHSISDGTIQFSKEQGSRFAKEIADDFNPLHDPDNKLFCIPGDLLFSVALAKYGLNQSMHFHFRGMVNEETKLIFPEASEDKIDIIDADNKVYLSIDRTGPVIEDNAVIESFARSYVAFSGHNFPDLLMPLMKESGVMINPQRPIVMYDSMEVSLTELENIGNTSLEYLGGTLEVNGKKGIVDLNFCLRSGDRVIGKGTKHMSLRGLKPYNQQEVDQLVTGYNLHKTSYNKN